MTFCSNREWKVPNNTFDKTPRYSLCSEEVINGKCPKHGKEINEPKEKKD